ncbi:MAG: glycosyltransferase family 2 protein, partial [Pseudomonadota bacterium]
MADELDGGMGAMTPREGPLFLSIVVPMYNEEASVDRFFEVTLETCRPMADRVEIVCVDDGSRDATVARVRGWITRAPEIRMVELTRNFGKEAALTAGFDHARGDAIVSIDADLQQPPSAIAEMVGKWREGWDVVGARRVDRDADSATRGFFSRRFYRFYNRIADTPIPAETSDFRLFDRAVVDALGLLRENTRFMKGLFSWVGYKVTAIEYVHGDRMAGTSSFKLWKL